MTDIQKGSGRRNMLKGAAVAAGAMTAPMISRAQTVSMRFQSTWPAKDIFHEYANDFASKVNNMASGRQTSGHIAESWPKTQGIGPD